ncbi:class I SAM-dependent methyltransferase [Oscillatoria acuminata]|uniref:Putative O-methyltransferase n=1 Tax=Oscillatoria acuminata PCC 6304 TaxID=56110 RepID=K9TD38_9CYAN|nr:class I SAM-dependent methyltransferase [Oscillatoria acuminata]AFY80056.1 putative O-methyltransferase [Oscillatoria acuminata PCC 6304]
MVNDYTQIVQYEGLPRGDYVSPNFVKVFPDACFPNLIVGDKRASSWKYARLDVPHNRYVDSRSVGVGFLNRDEAHIIYNTALKFRGKKALEIGCWLGWSACHLALAGVELDVIDPVLENLDFQESVENALRAAGVRNFVNLVSGYSPQDVSRLATEFNREWSLIFIDGNHDAPGPLDDAIACEKYAAADALILFHDLNSPEVAQGLNYFKEKGWKTLIYQTAQIMGVAWRGDVEPVEHHPDPLVDWNLPEHLQDYAVSGSKILQTYPREVQSVPNEYSLIPVPLRVINLIIFPNWNQPEEELDFQLSTVVRAIWNHPDVGRMTLLVETSDASEEEADLAISGAVMNLIMEREIDEKEAPEICLITDLTEKQWSAISSRIQGRIILPNENLEKIEARGSKYPAIFLDQEGCFILDKPPSLVFYSTKISQLVEENTGQLSFEEYAYITDVVSAKIPGNFLIFGVGKDSQLWLEVNKGGRTVFLEDNKAWLNQVMESTPGIEAYGVEYGTERKNWLDLLVGYNQGDDRLGLELPDSILQTQWDFIFVDAPAGYADETPGRMKSIYMAAQLAFAQGKTDVFVHDSDRLVENIYAGYFLRAENFITEVDKIKHYRIHE